MQVSLWGTILYFWSTPTGVHGKKWSPCGNWATICLTSKSAFIQLTTLLSFFSHMTSVRLFVPTQAHWGRYRLSSMVAMLLLLHTSAQTSSTAYQCMEKSHPCFLSKQEKSASCTREETTLSIQHVQSNHHSHIGSSVFQRSYPGGWPS